MSQRIYGIAAGEGIEIGAIQPITVSVADSLELSGTLHMLGDPVDIPSIYIGPWTDGGTSLQKSLGIDHRYNYTGGPAGAVAMPFRLYTLIEGAPEYYVWAQSIEMELRTTGNSPGQHVAYAASTRRLSGATPHFLYYGLHRDLTGLPAQVGSQSVGFELDINCSGPEAAMTAWDARVGARCMFAINTNAEAFTGWAAGVARAVGDVIFASPYNGYTYICTVAGTSGGTQPSWPTAAGTVSDGAATWQWGSGAPSQISRAIHIAAPGNASFGAGLLLDGNYYDAPIDMSFAVLDTATNPNAAGIRMAPNMYIDFSGGMSEVTQNLRVLGYDTASQKLAYRAGGFVRFAIDDDGPITIQVPTNAASDAAAAGAGVAVGEIYRNGSILMVRVA